MNYLLESYLDYLESDPLNEKKAPGLFRQLRKITRHGIVGQAKVVAGFTAVALALKALQTAFSKARKTCGSVFAGDDQAPAKKICIDKEKIKLYQKQLGILNSKKSECEKEKDPQLCLSKMNQKINNTRINIQITKDDLDQHMQEVREQFEQKLHNHGIFNEDDISLQELKIPKVTMTGAVVKGFEWFILGVIVDKALFLSWRSAQGLFSAASRKCGTFKKGPEREICMSKVRLQALDKKLGILAQVVSNCSKSKDPEKCTSRIKDEIDKVRARMEMERNNITILNKRLKLEKMQAAMKRVGG